MLRMLYQIKDKAIKISFRLYFSNQIGQLFSRLENCCLNLGIKGFSYKGFPKLFVKLRII